MIYSELLKGAMGGISWGLSRYFKKKGEAEEEVEFKPKRLIQPLVIGLAVGVASYQLGITNDAVVELLISYGAVGLIDSLGKAIWRKYFGVDWEKL